MADQFSPTKDDLTVQIEADLRTGTEEKAVLEERLKRVKAAKTDGRPARRISSICGP